MSASPSRGGRAHDCAARHRLASLLARRNLAHIRQIPEKLLDVTLQPLMFVLLFAFVFGGVIHVPGGNYREYLIGGILVQTLAFGMMGPGTSIATDLTEGIVDRFRSLPMARTAFLLGHMLAEFAGMIVAITILSICGPDRRLGHRRGARPRARSVTACCSCSPSRWSGSACSSASRCARRTR